MDPTPQASTSLTYTPAGLVDFAKLWRRKGTILSVTFLYVAAGAGYLTVAQTIYQVQCRIVVSENNPSFEPSRPTAPNREFIATQAEIIRSPLILREALKDAPITVPEGYEKGDVAYVLKTINVIPVIKTDLVKIVYRSSDSQHAKDLTAAIVRKYREYIQKSDRGRYGEDLKLLTKREAELRGQLELLQIEYTKFRRESPLIGEGRETIDVATDQLAHIGQRLSEARSRRIELENKLQSYSTALDKNNTTDDQPRVIPASQLTMVNNINKSSKQKNSSPFAGEIMVVDMLRDAGTASEKDLAQIQEEIWQAKARVEQLSQDFGPKHSEVLAAQRQISYFKELLRQKADATADGLMHELHHSVIPIEASLRQAYDQERSRAKELDDYLVQEAALKSRLHRAEEIYTTTLARLKEFQLTDEAVRNGRSTVFVSVLDGPNFVVDKIWPKPQILLGLSALFGIFSGVVLVSQKSWMVSPAQP